MLGQDLVAMLLGQPIVCQSGALSCCSNVFHEPTVMLCTSKTVPNLDREALFKLLPPLSQHIQAWMLVNTVTNTPSRDVTVERQTSVPRW